jgi:DNA invertase Pin-like site-specific DNA recombinase
MKGQKRDDITKEVLYRLYVLEKKTPTEIATSFSCSKSVITKKIKKYNFSTHRKRQNIPPEVLRDMAQNMTIPEIAEATKTDESTIHSKMTRNNIAFKRVYKKKRRADHTQDERIARLKAEGNDLYQIALITGKSKSTVYRRLKLMEGKNGET